MPVCENCDGQEFLLQDGLYYCVVCHLQSQEVVEEMLDEFDVGEYATESRKAAPKAKVVQDKGKPWYTAEAYQVILKAHIAALVDLGCSPQLYETTKQLWFKYIHKSGIAIIDSSLPALDKPENTCMSFRDRYLYGNLGKKCLKNDVVPDCKNALTKSTFSAYFTNRGSKRELHISSSSSSDDGDYESSSPRKKKKKRSVYQDRIIRVEEDVESLSDSSSELEEDKEDEIQVNVHVPENSKFPRIPARKRRKTIFELSMLRLITLLHTALQWNHEPVTAGDLIQWIRQGYLPYLDCLSCLLPHMKLFNYDAAAIRHRLGVPSYQTLAVQNREMVKYLEIASDIPDVDVRKLLVRYIIQLNFPHSFMSFVDSFIKISDYEQTRWDQKRGAGHCYIPEASALALIVVCCKLLFGLDDEREWKMEKDVQQCEQHVPCRSFSWDEWANYHVGRVTKERKNPPHCFASYDTGGVEDLHAYVKHWKDVVLQSTSHNQSKRVINIQSLRDKADAKASAFSKLCDMQGSTNITEALGNPSPFVFPAPDNENDMGSRCLRGVTKYLDDYDCDYVVYSDPFSRVENCFLRKNAPCQYAFNKNTWKRYSADFHLSYDFLLTMAQNVTCADKMLIHCEVLHIERTYLSPFLKAKSSQRFDTTSWKQNSKYVF